MDVTSTGTESTTRKTVNETTRLVVSKHRQPGTEHVDPQFLLRWSPRAFARDPVPDAHVRALFEAARWAPSSYNAQPWRFVYATREEDRERFLAPLFAGNRAWAQHAPVLVYLLAERTLERDGRENRHAWFDTGAAWMSLALQAGKLGLHAHAMGGFDADAARAVLRVPDHHDVVAAVAIGYRDDAAPAPDARAQRDVPSGRKALHEIAFEARFRGFA